MPIYEYVCMECESHFEELVRGDQQVACPDCEASNVKRQFSVFATHGTAATPSFGGGGGDPDADLMFLGEAPGFHEDRQGVPFVGQAGKLLENLLAGIGLRREEV